MPEGETRPPLESFRECPPYVSTRASPYTFACAYASNTSLKYETKPPYKGSGQDKTSFLRGHATIREKGAGLSINPHLNTKFQFLKTNTTSKRGRVPVNTITALLDAVIVVTSPRWGVRAVVTACPMGLGAWKGPHRET